ncbi:MAG: PaaI family thioesterase [Clostridiales Family XIII bacterium]|jgi:acyl-CoA thioesterase|nr:PaaI family thioesterase [Clostridiales Family XIII bacterium]
MDIQGIRDYFYGDRYLTMTGVIIEEAEDGRSVCRVEIEPDKHFNKGGIVQGGVTYTLADCAFAVASNYRFIDRGETDKFLTVSQSASITYFRPPKGKSLICEAKAISRGRVTSVYRMEVRDEKGTDVALMIGHGYTIVL